LLEVLRRRMRELGVTYDALDHIAGLCRGHSNKVLGRTPSKGIGKVSFGCILGALGLQVVVRVDKVQAERMASRWAERQLRHPVKHPRAGPRATGEAADSVSPAAGI
jgi:hypothetical protein